MEAHHEQLAKITDYLQKLRSHYVTYSTIDRPKVEAALKIIYEAMGLSNPQIVYENSPLAASANFSLDYWGNELIRIDELIEQNLKQELGTNLWQQLHYQIYEPSIT